MAGHRLTTELLVLATAALMLAACDGSITFGDGVTGSGDLVTESYEFDGFDSVLVGSTFDAVITVGDASLVEVLIDDNLLDRLDIGVRDGELQLVLEDGTSLRDATLEATVQLPELVALDVSGSSTVEVVGASGPRLDIDVSGASELSVDGTAAEVLLEASGASDVFLNRFEVGEAVVDISGASMVQMIDAEVVRGEVSGASDLLVAAASDVAVDTSGASTLERS